MHHSHKSIFVAFPAAIHALCELQSSAFLVTLFSGILVSLLCCLGDYRLIIQVE